MSGRDVTVKSCPVCALPTTPVTLHSGDQFTCRQCNTTWRLDPRPAMSAEGCAAVYPGGEQCGRPRYGQHFCAEHDPDGVRHRDRETLAAIRAAVERIAGVLEAQLAGKDDQQ